MGTRDAMTKYQWHPWFNPEIDYFRARYLRDLDRNRPPGFLDTGGDSFDPTGQNRFTHEVWPELSAVIARDYVLVGTVGTDRFYMRRDRVHG
jgi:hypothetical protein